MAKMLLALTLARGKIWEDKKQTMEGVMVLLEARKQIVADWAIKNCCFQEH